MVTAWMSKLSTKTRSWMVLRVLFTERGDCVYIYICVCLCVCVCIYVCVGWFDEARLIDGHHDWHTHPDNLTVARFDRHIHIIWSLCKSKASLSLLMARTACHQNPLHAWPLSPLPFIHSLPHSTLHPHPNPILQPSKVPVAFWLMAANPCMT